MSIKIYSKPDCVWCDRAKKLMNSRSIPYNEVVLGKDFSLADIREAFPTMKTFPVIVNDSNLVGGYTDLVEKVAENENFGKILLNE